MRDAHFEWDDEKAASNVRKHGITFHDARAVFLDPLAIEAVDAGPDEERATTIGIAAIGPSRTSRVLVVISTERQGRTRIISARTATAHERKRYEHGE